VLGVEIELLSLFAICFLAATILPAQSEIILGALYIAGDYNGLLLLAIATVGNVLGSCANWLIGRFIRYFENKKWFAASDKAMAKATTIYQKYGIWTLLFAWMPFIGDPLTIVSGILRANFYVFVVLVTIGKCGRYLVLLYALGFRL
jgi:membrane protein YqaA with SNARE-associated domain